MAPEEDDLYDEEYEFVDDVDEDGDDTDEESTDDSSSEESFQEDKADESDEDVDEYGRPSPAANYVVHIYEHQKLKRTIERPFTPEEAEAFASEYNRTSKPYGRLAVAGKNDAKPKKSVD